jgi:Mn2+/Fe2+ NRAMP family transporter
LHGKLSLTRLVERVNQRKRPSTFLRVNPIQLIFWANVIAGVIAPLLVILILLLGNNRKIMKNQRLSLLNNVGLVLIALIMLVGAVLLFYGLATGQGS